MKGIALAMALTAALLAVIACRGEQPDTPDIEATVEASVYATRVAEGLLEATIEARVAIAVATQGAEQTPAPPPVYAHT